MYAKPLRKACFSGKSGSSRSLPTVRGDNPNRQGETARNRRDSAQAQLSYRTIFGEFCCDPKVIDRELVARVLGAAPYGID